jgi:hypothetical protein
VLEYGVSKEAQMNDKTLDATLRMQAGAAGANYAIFWKQVGDQGIFAASYEDAMYTADLAKVGKKLAFTDVSTSVTVDVFGDSPVADVMRTRQPKFVEDLSKTTDERAYIAEEVR